MFTRKRQPRRQKRGSKKIRTRKQYIATLKELYPSCLHQSHISKPEYQEDNTTYGEMNYEGMAKLYSEVKKMNKSIQTFIDVGSGYGKLNIFMASYDKIKKSIGIELVQERYEHALGLLKQMDSQYSHKVEFKNDNILDIDINSLIHPQGAVFVWWSNLCFSQDKVNEMYEKIAAELPKGSIIACSKQMTNVETQPKTMIIPMSWSATSTVYIYSNL